MELIDLYPDKVGYFAPDDRSDEQKQAAAEEAKGYLRGLEQGYYSNASMLAMNLMWHSETRDECIKYARMALDLPVQGNSHNIANYVLAGLHIPLEEYDQAIELLEKGRESDPAADFVCMALYAIYYHVGKYREALGIALIEYEAHNKSWEGEPMNDEGSQHCQNIGLCHAHLGEFAAAREWFQRALGAEDLKPRQIAELQYQTGLSWQSDGDELRARAFYKKSIEASPDIPEVYNNLASMAFNENGQVQEAIQLLKEALDRLPNEQGEPAITIWKNLQTMYKTIVDYDGYRYAKYRTICAMGMGMLFRDPSKEDGEDDETNFGLDIPLD